MKYRLDQLGVAPSDPVQMPVTGEHRRGDPGGRAHDRGSHPDHICQIITGRRSVKELGGPLKIAQVSGERFVLGPTEFVFLIALVSINLGFINLLPVPMRWMAAIFCSMRSRRCSGSRSSRK